MNRWLSLTDLARRQLARVGIPTRHTREFSGDSAMWSRQQIADYVGPDQPTAWQRLSGVQFMKHMRDTMVRVKALNWGLAQMGPNARAGLLTVLPPSVYAMPDFTAFQNELKGYNEIVRWPLYAYKAYPAAGSTQIALFDQTEGNATNRRADTNMQAPNQLPGNQMQVVHSIRVFTIPAEADVKVVGAAGAVAFEEWYSVLTDRCWCEVTISDKLYLVAAPLTLLPAGMGVGSVFNNPGLAAGGSVGISNNGHPSNEALFKTDPPLGILPTRTFSVTLNWIAVITVTTAGRIGVTLDGWRLRAVQ